MPWRKNNSAVDQNFASIHGCFKLTPGQVRWCPSNNEPRHPDRPNPYEDECQHQYRDGLLETEVI